MAQWEHTGEKKGIWELGIWIWECCSKGQELGEEPQQHLALGTRTEPVLGPATPSGLGLEASPHQEGFVTLPTQTKLRFYWNFGRQNCQGFFFGLCSEGECAEGLLQNTPTALQGPQNPTKKGELWLWNCSRSRDVGAGSS